MSSRPQPPTCLPPTHLTKLLSITYSPSPSPISLSTFKPPHAPSSIPPSDSAYQIRITNHPGEYVDCIPICRGMWDQWHVIKQEKNERGEKQELLPKGLIEELEWLVDVRGGAAVEGWKIDSITRFPKKNELHLYITKPLTGAIDNFAESKGFIPRNPLGFSETERIAWRPDRELGRKRQGWYLDGSLSLRKHA